MRRRLYRRHRESTGRNVERSRKESSYRDVLGLLVVTEDLEIPGIARIGVRLLPTREALAGSPAPVVLIPRVIGTSWYGAEIVARF